MIFYRYGIFTLMIFMSHCSSPTIDMPTTTIPNTLSSDSATRCVSLLISERINKKGEIEDSFLVKDAALIQRLWRNLCSYKFFLPAAEMNWSVPLYVGFYDSQNELVGAFRSDRSRSILLPMNALRKVKNNALHFDSPIHAFRMGNATVFFGIPASDEIRSMELLLKNSVGVQNHDR